MNNEVEENMKVKLSSEILPVLHYYQTVWASFAEDTNGQKIKEGEALSSVASFYERLRYTIDYKKEHLLRRNAIERILKRIIREKGDSQLEEVSGELIKELIWAKYVKNDYYPTGKIAIVSKIISKYLTLSGEFYGRSDNARNPIKWRDWLLAVASCEIEESLDPTLESFDVLSMAIQVWFEDKYEWKDSDLSVEEKENQLAIAVHRSLFRSDEAKNAYYLLKRLQRGWSRENAESLRKNIDGIYKVFVGIKQSLSNRYQARLYRFVQKQAVAFQVLKSYIENNPDKAGEIIKNPVDLREQIYKICEEKYSEISSRVNRGIIRSIIYIFITKVLFAIAIEIPYEFYFLGGISILPIISTVTIPLIFVFLVGLTIKRPGEANTQRIIESIFDFVYEYKKEPKLEFSLPLKKRGLRYRAFDVAYWLLFLGTFSFISYLLISFGFNYVGIAIFFIFLSLVLLFGYRVKYSASELNVVIIRENLASNLINNVSLPFLDLGVWLADKFAQLNFLVVLFDFLIEAPFKNIIGIIDEWTTFLREKKEEAIEAPVER